MKCHNPSAVALMIMTALRFSDNILPIIFYRLPFKIWSLFNSFINFSLKFFWMNLCFSYHFSILVFSLLFVHKLSWDLQVEGWGDEIFLVNNVRMNGQGYWHWRNTYFYNCVIQVLISLWSPEARTYLAYNIFVTDNWNEVQKSYSNILAEKHCYYY